jgi:hypothetical protein
VQARASHDHSSISGLASFSPHPNIPALGQAPQTSGSFTTAASSDNWAGYALNAPIGSVTYVQGDWKVPTVLGPVCASTAWHSSVDWIGIDGFASGTVEQIGTASQCYEGALQYFAWYEFYPAGSVMITTVPVSPGDTIAASVSFSGGSFVVFLKDVTTGKSFKSAPTVVSGAQESSAEWIVESPFGSIGELELANTGTNTFYGALATVSGTKASISHFASIAFALTMVDFPAGSPTKATVSGLSTNGQLFSTKWVSQGPYG